MAEVDDKELENLRAQAEAGASAAAALDKSQADLAAATTDAATAVADALRIANPDLPADAIAGATIAEVQASTQRARTIADHVKAATATTPTVPDPAATAGQATAPPRTTEPNTAGLRGAARIRAGLDALAAPK